MRWRQSNPDSAPGDRDESRFAQASKEMLEENNYIVIQYQDELRNKKPAGIHWLQAASTAASISPRSRKRRSRASSMRGMAGSPPSGRCPAASRRSP